MQIRCPGVAHALCKAVSGTPDGDGRLGRRPPGPPWCGAFKTDRKLVNFMAVDGTDKIPAYCALTRMSFPHFPDTNTAVFQISFIKKK